MTGARQNKQVATVRIGAAVVIAALAVLARVLALGSDPYSRLSWSSGLITDEGFYVHNARNVVLFGHARTDGFNNDLIMPTLHYLQIEVFRVFGVGAVQARAISVALSILTLIILFAGLRRAFGTAVACYATLFLGLDHTVFLYNRLALIDTPGAFVMVCAFYAFVRGVTAAQTVSAGRMEAGPGIDHRPSAVSLAWMAACGLLLALTMATRGMAVFVLVAPPVALFAARRDSRDVARAVVVLVFGLLVGTAVYAALWYVPHRAQIVAVDHYYLGHQLYPHSLRAVCENLTVAMFGDERGMMPYLFRHSPVQIVLALAGLIAGFLAGIRSLRPAARACSVYLAVWLLAAWLMLGVIDYSPSRYYVLFYPAMAAIAAIALAEIRLVWRAICASPVARTALAALIAYHSAEPLLHHRPPAAEIGLYALTALAGLVALRFGARWSRVAGIRRTPAPLLAAVLCIWLVVNGYWTGDWLRGMSYDQRDADRWLGANLPPGTVLIGDVAPGLCLNNRLVSVNVIWGLCNDHDPIEAFAPAPRAIAILDGTWKEPWWRDRYPQYVAADHRLKLFPRLLHWPVGIYLLRPVHASVTTG